MTNYDRRLNTILLNAAKAGKPDSRAYWEARTKGLDDLASALLKERPLERSYHASWEQHVLPRLRIEESGGDTWHTNPDDDTPRLVQAW